MKRTTFTALAHASKKTRTRREAFLGEMEAVVPWAVDGADRTERSEGGLKGGRPPTPLDVMLRVSCLQQWYALSDPAAEGSSV